MNDLLAGATAITVLAAALAAIAQWVVRPLMSTLKRVRAFLDDWNGEPGRPGVAKRPGVMERMEALQARVEAIEHELHPNSGRSLRDRVDETHTLVHHLSEGE